MTRYRTEELYCDSCDLLVTVRAKVPEGAESIAGKHRIPFRFGTCPKCQMVTWMHDVANARKVGKG